VGAASQDGLMMPEKSETIGLLLMAYGSPEDLSQMEAYLLDVREGRAPSPELVEEISERYRKIGGKSPLLERTSEQAKALEKELNKRFTNSGKVFKAFVGMRHWQPRIESAVNLMVAANIQKAVGLVMAPHNSRMSIGKYYQMLDEALDGQEIDFMRIQSWHKHPGLLDAIAEKIEIGLSNFGEEIPYVIFTAHSLPTKILEMGDPYDDQLNETAWLLAERFELQTDRWQFCYQSAGARAIPWLGPQIEEVVSELAQKGKKNLLVVPIGFVCDHVEVLYDIDIGAYQIAQQHGARLERTPSLNDSPTFVAALADLVQEHLLANNQE
jgi:protoporphyrin/coproporphyrin ferrochelatase